MPDIRSRRRQGAVTASGRVPPSGWTRLRWRAAVAIAAVVLAGVLAPTTAQAATTSRLAVTGLSLTSGGTWGDDLVTIKGTGFGGSGRRGVSAVLFGAYPADGFEVVNATTIQAFTPEIPNAPTAATVRVALRDNEVSRPSAGAVFTFFQPNLDTRINGHWSANQARAIGASMLGRAAALDAMPVAGNPGYWTPAMGRSALQRAAGWLGMPYSWAGGTYQGPSYGSCSGDGANHVDCTYQGFDCSGLTLYAWAKYQHLAHFAATQFTQAGTFHPTLGELQPGDLMFFSEGGPVISHVVMYAGGGRVIQASESGWPVRYSTLAQVMSNHPSYFGATRPMSLGAQGAAPVVSSVSVARSGVAGGARITIHGANFDTASLVDFGAVGTYHFSINSPTTITAVVPAHAAGIANVRVYNAWGESTANRRTAVTYFGAPTVTALSLAKAGAAGGDVMIITGSGFSPDARAYFGTTPARSTRVLSSTHLSVVVPNHPAGPVAVEVRTAYGRSNHRSVTYIAPAAVSPATTAASPATTAASPATTAASPAAAGTAPAAAAPTATVPGS